MLFINATLSKNQLYKHKAKKTKSLLSASKTTWSSFPIISARDFTVCNLHSCYHNGRVFICSYQGVILSKNEKLF